MRTAVRPVTIVSFHAHPDDEAILTAGTLARLSSAGHRVVLVMATAGEAGLAVSSHGRGDALASTRGEELRASAQTIGVSAVIHLRYADSGYPRPPQTRHHGEAATVGPIAFADEGVERAAERLASVLLDEDADILTIYDPNGGYGHPDHVQVHRVGIRAAELARTRVVLEATVDRRALMRVGRLLHALRYLGTLPQLPDPRTIYTARSELTHRIDVRDQWRAKRAAMHAHVSQTESDAGVRTLALFLRLPHPVFRRVFRYEWFREVGRDPGPRLLDDVLHTLAKPGVARASESTHPVH